MARVVGVGDLQLSGDPAEQLITYALGSCVGVAAYDPMARVGGLLHAMLPLSTIDPEKAQQNPCMFMDTGLVRLFLECYKLGAKKHRMVVAAAGGASPSRPDREDFFQIGRRNVVMLKKMLWRNGVLLAAQDLGGTESRTMTLDMPTGVVRIKSGGREADLLGASERPAAPPPDWLQFGSPPRTLASLGTVGAAAPARTQEAAQMEAGNGA